MKVAFWKRGFPVFTALALTALTTAGFADEPNVPVLQKEASSGSPLIDEMLKLDSSFHEITSGVVLGDGERVHRAVETVHGTMEKTHEGIHQGTVKLPRNAGHLREFVALDKKFHARLERLAGAAEKNNQQAMLKLTKEILDSCVRCHRMFRKR